MSEEQSSLPEGMELRDIAPPASVWDLGDVLTIGGATALALLACASLVIGLVWWRRRPRFPALPACPEEELQQAVESSRSRSGAVSGRESAVHASSAIRTFLHRRYGSLASYATTGELAGSPGSEALLLPDAVAPLLECLESLDTVRFRPEEISEAELMVLLDKVSHWLESNPVGQADEHGDGLTASGNGTPESPYELASVPGSGAGVDPRTIEDTAKNPDSVAG